MRATQAIATVLLARSERDPETGCLRWTGGHTHKGYGSVRVEGRSCGVHRVAYETWIGPIPDGLEVDHVYERGCRHRDCIEPDHLEAVTHAENVRRRVFQRIALEERVTHCPRGHEYTPENSIWKGRPTGHRWRICRECQTRRNAVKRPCRVCGKQVRAGNAATHIKRVHKEGS